MVMMIKYLMISYLCEKWKPVEEGFHCNLKAFIAERKAPTMGLNALA